MTEAHLVPLELSFDVMKAGILSPIAARAGAAKTRVEDYIGDKFKGKFPNLPTISGGMDRHMAELARRGVDWARDNNPVTYQEPSGTGLGSSIRDSLGNIKNDIFDPSNSTYDQHVDSSQGRGWWDRVTGTGSYAPGGRARDALTDAHLPSGTMSKVGLASIWPKISGALLGQAGGGGPTDDKLRDSTGRLLQKPNPNAPKWLRVSDANRIEEEANRQAALQASSNQVAVVPNITGGAP